MKASPAILLTLVLAAAPALGCPLCDTEGGAAVRAGIFNGTFVRTLAQVLLIFPVVGLVLHVTNRLLPD